MNNKGNSSSSFNWKKVVGIVAGVLVVAALIVSLVSCQKKKSDSDKPKERKVEEKDKKPKKKKDDEKLEVVDEDVVIYSDFSNENSTAKVTNMSNNTNKASKKEEKKEEKKDDDPVDTTDPEISDVTKAIVENTNTIALTFTVTDESEITEVKVGDEVLTAVDGQYKFIATANGSYTVNAKDANGNIGTKTVEVTELIDVDNIITRGDVDRGHYDRQGRWVPGTGNNDYYRTTINVDSSDVTVSHVRYASTRNDYSSSVSTSTFVRDDGTYRNRVTINGSRYDVTAVSDNSKEITSQNNQNYYYVYYEASKTTDAGTAKVADVETVNFTS